MVPRFGHVLRGLVLSERHDPHSFRERPSFEQGHAPDGGLEVVREDCPVAVPLGVAVGPYLDAVAMRPQQAGGERRRDVRLVSAPIGHTDYHRIADEHRLLACRGNPQPPQERRPRVERQLMQQSLLVHEQGRVSRVQVDSFDVAAHRVLIVLECEEFPLLQARVLVGGDENAVRHDAPP